MRQYSQLFLSNDVIILNIFQCLDIQIMLYGPQHKKTKATQRTVDMLFQWVFECNIWYLT